MVNWFQAILAVPRMPKLFYQAVFKEETEKTGRHRGGTEVVEKAEKPYRNHPLRILSGWWREYS